jgi:hypothetical protein
MPRENRKGTGCGKWREHPQAIQDEGRYHVRIRVLAGEKYDCDYWISN